MHSITYSRLNMFTFADFQLLLFFYVAFLLLFSHFRFYWSTVKQISLDSLARSAKNCEKHWSKITLDNIFEFLMLDQHVQRVVDRCEQVKKMHSAAGVAPAPTALFDVIHKHTRTDTVHTGYIRPGRGPDTNISCCAVAAPVTHPPPPSCSRQQQPPSSHWPWSSELLWRVRMAVTPITPPPRPTDPLL